MNILLASHGFPPTHSAGAERRTERMAKWLSKHGHRVEVFTVERVNDPHRRIETCVQDGFLVHRLYYDIHEGDPFENTYNEPFVGECLRRLLEKEQFDLLHIVSGYLLGVPAIEVAKQMGLPVVITLTEFWFMCTRLNLIQRTGALCTGPETVQKCTRCLLEDKRRYRLAAQNVPSLMDFIWPLSHRIGLTYEMQNQVQERQMRLKKALESVDLVISPSQHLIHKFHEFGFDTKNFVHIRQGLAVPPLEAIQSSFQRSPDSPLRVTYIGQLKYHKGVDLVVKAAIKLLEANQNLVLNLWGKETEAPEYVGQLKSLTASYHPIQWRGHFSGDRIWDILRETDVLVMPSRWYENSPNIILEAFAMRVPVIATNLGGMAELVSHEQNGLLFEIGNANELQYQIKRLLDDGHPLLARLRRGIQAVKTLEQEMKEIIPQYAQLLRLCAGLFLVIGISL